MDDIVEIRGALKDAWIAVENAYKGEKLNSERAMQAVIYCSLIASLPNDKYTVLVEPGWNFIDPPAQGKSGFEPDLVIVSTSRRVVLCAMELKFAPHYWIRRAEIISDLEKLEQYRETKRVRLDIFAQERPMDDPKSWQLDFSVEQNLMLVFATLSRDNNDLRREFYKDEKVLEDLLNYPQFQFLCAAVDDGGRANFSIGHKEIDRCTT